MPAWWPALVAWRPTCQHTAAQHAHPPCRSNFITDKPSSRVLAPPGGGSSIVFG